MWGLEVIISSPRDKDSKCKLGKCVHSSSPLFCIHFRTRMNRWSRGTHQLWNSWNRTQTLNVCTVQHTPFIEIEPCISSAGNIGIWIDLVFRVTSTVPIGVNIIRTRHGLFVSRCLLTFLVQRRHSSNDNTSTILENRHHLQGLSPATKVLDLCGKQDLARFRMPVCSSRSTR